MYFQVWQPWRQGKVPTSEGEPSAECTRISLRFLSRRYDRSGVVGKIACVSRSEERMLKLWIMIRLVPMLNGQDKRQELEGHHHLG